MAVREPVTPAYSLVHASVKGFDTLCVEINQILFKLFKIIG